MTVTLEAKRRSQRRRRTFRRGAIAAVVLVPPALLGAAAYSPFLDVDTVRVTGTHRLAAATVVRTAGVDRGTPLVSLDIGAVRRRVLAMQGVKNATVTRSWPSTVTVRVVERVPVVAVPRGVAIDLYDIEAALVATVPAAPATMPSLAVAAGSPSREAVDAAVALLRALPAALRSQVRDLRADGTSLSFGLADGGLVLWGSADRTPEKVRALSLLAPQHAKRYDVRVPDRPAVVPRS